MKNKTIGSLLIASLVTCVLGLVNEVFFFLGGAFLITSVILALIRLSKKQDWLFHTFLWVSITFVSFTILGVEQFLSEVAGLAFWIVAIFVIVRLFKNE
jgi:hypothetical protein